MQITFSSSTPTHLRIFRPKYPPVRYEENATQSAIARQYRKTWRRLPENLKAFFLTHGLKQIYTGAPIRVLIRRPFLDNINGIQSHRRRILADELDFNETITDNRTNATTIIMPSQLLKTDILKLDHEYDCQVTKRSARFNLLDALSGFLNERLLLTPQQIVNRPLNNPYRTGKGAFTNTHAYKQAYATDVKAIARHDNPLELSLIEEARRSPDECFVTVASGILARIQPWDDFSSYRLGAKIIAHAHKPPKGRADDVIYCPRQLTDQKEPIFPNIELPGSQHRVAAMLFPTVRTVIHKALKDKDLL